MRNPVQIYGFNNLWAVTYRNAVHRLDNGQWEVFQSKPSKFGSYLLEDSKGNVWLLSYGGGLGVYNGNSWIYYDKASGLPSDYVSAFGEDLNGIPWIACEGMLGAGGVASLHDGKWVKHEAVDAWPSRYIMAIAFDSSNRGWFGTDEGIGRLDGTNAVFWSSRTGDVGSYVMAAKTDRSGIPWFGTQEGIYRWNGENFDVFRGPKYIAVGPEPSVQNWLNSILMDSRGHLFFNSAGAKAGISEFDGVNWKVYNELRDSRTITFNPQGLLTIARADTLVTMSGQGYSRVLLKSPSVECPDPNVGIGKNSFVTPQARNESNKKYFDITGRKFEKIGSAKIIFKK